MIKSSYGENHHHAFNYLVSLSFFDFYDEMMIFYEIEIKKILKNKTTTTKSPFYVTRAHAHARAHVRTRRKIVMIIIIAVFFNFSTWLTSMMIL